jgi:uncharacterized protein YegP (UPF0339 family)
MLQECCNICLVARSKRNKQTTLPGAANMIAHIFKAKAGQFTLILSTGAAINTGVISETLYASKAEAKAAAKAAGATPHNY